MPYRFWTETPQCAYLVRQYFHTNLLERMGSFPSLTAVEKRWIAYQLLEAMRQIHQAGLCHGDIKAENVMITSWGWLFLCDFASFKPRMLPQDDPSDFHYYFCGASFKAGGGGGRRAAAHLRIVGNASLSRLYATSPE